VYTLHLITTDDVAAFLQSRPEIVELPNEREAKRLLLDLATFLSERQPAWYFDEISLSGWEASIERGIGMMLRPPSRILIDAGMDRDLAHALPIRLEATGGPSAGAYIPATLIPQARQLLEARLDRQLARLRDAEMDPVANVGAMLAALETAEAAGTGLLEAAGVAHGSLGKGQPLVVAERKSLPPDLRKRLEAAAKPPKKPGLLARLRGERVPARQPDVSEFWDGTAE
jgi:hypothetical protein